MQSETDFPVTPPENNTALTPNTVSSLNFGKSAYKNEQKFTTSAKESKIFNIGVKELNVQKIKLPALDVTNKTAQNRKLQKNTYSLDNCKFLMKLIGVILFVVKFFKCLRNTKQTT